MAPCLDDCSPEILGIVLAQLNRQDAGALRQCSRWLASICMENRHFKSLFDSKRVEVTERGLEDLAKFTKPGRIGALLQKLTVIGLATNVWSGHRPPRLIKCHKHSTEDERKLLSEAFRTIATHSHSGKLASLTLKVDLIEDGEKVPDCELWRYDFKFSWYAAARVFDLAWRALAMSALQVEGLNIFSDIEMRSGALSCELLTELDWEDPGLLKSFASIQSLSMSLSTRLIEEYEPEEDENEVGEHGTDRGGRDRRESPKRREVDDLRAEVANEKNFIGLGKLLRHCQQLSNVDIHYATLRYHPREFSELVQTRLLQRTVEAQRTLRQGG
ncbi:hypothetical protein LTR46_000747 [Exophiala xenobiotica]|nr:hypothetical protein LTR46_000747 [Exophiala xenobiotica]